MLSVALPQVQMRAALAFTTATSRMAAAAQAAQPTASPVPATVDGTLALRIFNTNPSTGGTVTVRPTNARCHMH